MINANEQLYMLNNGLNLKDYFLLQFLKSAPQQLNIRPTIIVHECWYKLTLEFIEKQLPFLQVQKRQLMRMLQKLENIGFIEKNKAKLGFVYRLRSDIHVTTEQLEVTSMSRLKYKKSQVKPAVNIFFTNKYSNNIYNNIINNTFNNNINIIHIEDEDLINNTNNIYYINNTKNTITNYQTKRAQIETAKKLFSKLWPNKNDFFPFNKLDEVPRNFNPELLVKKIKESPEFLAVKSELGLFWCIKNYDAIINDFYKSYKKENSHFNNSLEKAPEREYSNEELNQLYDSLDDIVLEENNE